jgi:diguanylate cyclase (GGDEF)-like protein
MTLYKQISIALLLFLLIAFAGTMYLGATSIQEVYSEQLASHTQDTATSLGLSLSLHMEAQDLPMMESIINAAFDRGDFLRIELVSTNGTSLIVKSRKIDTTGVPSWFIRILSLDTPAAEALVMSGWKQSGMVRVTGNPAAANVKFWKGTVNTLRAYLAAAFVLLVLALIAVRFLLLPLRDIRQQADAICNRNYIVQTKLPKTRELRSVVVAMNRLSGKVNQIFTEHAALTEALREQVYQDPLTGVGNRRYFDRILTALVEDQDQVSNGALLLLELRNLSRLNEAHGYATGDEILKRAAQLIQSQLKQLENCYTAHVSGATFAIIAAGLPPESADSLASSLCHILFQLRADGLVHSNDIGNIGIAMWRQGYRTSDLMSEADLALRAAQSSGQNTWQRYNSGSTNQPDIYGTGRWRSHLQSIIEHSNIILAAQPVYSTDTQSRNVLHYEVLTRIPDPGGTGISAALFMPMAERLGLASQLDKLTISTLIELIRSESNTSRTYAINLSSTSLHDAVFLQWLCSHLTRLPSVAKRVMLEFPEYAAVANLQNVRNLVDRLADLGCMCGIDHFGRGFSPYGYLRSIRIRYLKIDASHVRNIDSDRDSQFFVKSLTDTMHSIDIQVYAQAVETNAQKDILEKLNLDGIQGYLLGKPAVIETGIAGNICQE